MKKEMMAVDGETLWDLEFSAQRFCVRGLLPQGLCILGGAPKIGKSWLVLDWCIRIARGEPIWGMDTTQGTTLYLCLEDTLQRVQHRVYCMSEEATPNAYFATAVGTLADDLEEQISSFLLSHPDTVLVVVDTFQMVRGNTNDPSYGSDYQDMQKINKTFRFTEAAEQFRHENYLPPIVTKELWEQVQALMEMRKKANVRAGEGQAIHRYSGLIVCGDCGRAFTAKTVKSKSGIRTEYWCSTYLRYGKEYCGSHAIREEYLDEIIKTELLSTKEQYQQMWGAMQDSINRWTPQANNTLAQVKKLRQKIESMEEEMEDILMERIRDKANAERYDRMIQKREEQIAQAKKKIAELENLGQTIRSRQAKLKKDISLIDEILADGQMTEAHLRLLIEKIYVYQAEDGLSLDIKVKAPFQNHTDTYENGVLTNRELEEIIQGVGA